MEENFIENLINNLRQERDLWGDSINWANWISQLALNTCQYCVEQHGKIVDITVLEDKKLVNAHPNCQCEYAPVRTKQIGTATDWGMEGADAYLVHFGRLPDYYVDKQTAQKAGWQTKNKKFSSLFPGKMLGGDIYANDDYKLPSVPGRVWHEADINYAGGKRNRQRIIYSNDGLIFVTYDHYQTFYEITR